MAFLVDFWLFINRFIGFWCWYFLACVPCAIAILAIVAIGDLMARLFLLYTATQFKPVKRN